MTLVLALSCRDGIVMASDSEAVGVSSGGPIRYRLRKIHEIGAGVLLGASGAISTIQRSVDIVKGFSKELENGLDSALRNEIKGRLFSVFREAAEMHKSYYGSAEGSPIADLLICTTDKNKVHKIWHIAKDCNDEFLEDIGYACTGGGDTFAYTLLKGVYNKGLDVKKCALIAYKVISDAIEVGAYGLGGPVDIWIINSSGAEHLSAEKLEKIHIAYGLWKRQESDFIANLKPDGLF